MVISVMVHRQCYCFKEQNVTHRDITSANERLHQSQCSSLYAFCRCTSARGFAHVSLLAYAIPLSAAASSLFSISRYRGLSGRKGNTHSCSIAGKARKENRQIHLDSCSRNINKRTASKLQTWKSHKVGQNRCILQMLCKWMHIILSLKI